MDAEVEALRHGLAKIPQELYDEIYNLVFTAPPGIRDLSADSLAIGGQQSAAPSTRKYRAALSTTNLLQVSRSTRELYASTYYGEGEFLFSHKKPDMFSHTNSDNRICEKNMRRMVAWAISLPEKHQRLVKKIHFRVEIFDSEYEYSRGPFQSWFRKMKWLILSNLIVHCAGLNHRQVCSFHYGSVTHGSGKTSNAPSSKQDL
ncbi:uncharacterized protein RCC_09861 [Ramularia collo-cygni]|uniref:Uncharacterized protein n=1 Tax=Ramularia collo-cygni TaxID=112498 RepID=A0A2D3VMV1_9PEZI|nr:uncharacterized protein RCC_09861 [Ramularia collo-cygni]CZT24144.1 uncharacterized protein RCC_09861 [Ramularia collo-cygni]